MNPAIVRASVEPTTDGQFVWKAWRRVVDPVEDSGFAWRPLGGGIKNTRALAVSRVVDVVRRALLGATPVEADREGGGA